MNIILDPLFMFVLLPSGNEVAGAAMATALSNTVGLIYFGIYLYTHQKNTLDGQKEKKKAAAGRLFGEIVKGGIPGFCMVALAMFSNCFLNSMISTLGSAAVAGLGIVRKIDQLAYAVNQGVTQGMLPLVAYCYSAGRRLTDPLSCCSDLYADFCDHSSISGSRKGCGTFHPVCAS